MSSAAARKIQGAVLVMAAPNGASMTANSTASGTATKAATMAPETILRRAMCGTPSSSTSSVSGASVVVSSVPETRPMAANTTAPTSPMAAATAMSLRSCGSMPCAPRLQRGARPGAAVRVSCVACAFCSNRS